MTIEAWIDDDLAREKTTSHTPIVTIFGAGVTGLTLAHELVERGFGVQVVEARPDPDDEYSCEVGGLAANQVGRVPAEIERVHPYLFKEEDRAGEDAVDPDERCVRVWVVGTGAEKITIRIDEKSFAFTTDQTWSAQKIAEEIRDGAIDGGFDAEVDGYAVVLKSKRAGEALRVSVGAGDSGGSPSQLVRYESLATLAQLRAAEMEPVEPRFPLPHRLQFERPMSDGDWREIEDEHCKKNAEKIDEIWAILVKAYKAHTAGVDSNIEKKKGSFAEGELSERMRRREEFLLEVRGHTDGDGAPGVDRDLSLDWAKLVRDELLARNDGDGNTIPDLEKRILLIGVGGAERLGNPRRRVGRRRANRVELRIVEHHIPGEHGYRFFPGFYRHLFDTMRRTPILDERGRETGRTAFDQLEAVDVVDVALEDERRPHRVPVRAARSLEELRELMRMHLDPERLGVKERDLLLFTLRMLQFLTSSTERRRGEYEQQSWWDYLIGTDEGGNARYHYTPAMDELLRTTPEALVAMRADETDARTQGAVYAQLLTDVLRDGSEANRTLNGPTSEAWLGHWKRYLQRQGVRFFVGELTKLEWFGDELRPLVTRKTHECGVASLQIILADPRSIDLEVNGLDVSVDLPSGASLGDAVDELASRIDGNPDLGVEANTSDVAEKRAGRLELRSRHTQDDVLLRIRPFVGYARLKLFGVDLPVSMDGIPPVEGDPLADVVVRRLRSSYLISPPDGDALLWIRSRSAGRYGAEIDRQRVEIVVDEEEAPLPTEEIRDRFMAAIAEEVRHLHPHRTGTTGIRLIGADRRPVHVDVERWRDRIGRGVDLRVDRGRFPQLDVLRGDSLRIRIDDPALAVVGAVPEVPDEPLIEARFEEDDGGQLRSLPVSGGGPDFYVMALPFDEVSRLVWQAHEDGQELAPPRELDGCFEQMMAFEQKTARRDDSGSALPLVRDPDGRPTPLKYPLRDLSGIQYYFTHQVRIGRGHTYYPKAPWGLSSISQVAYWRERMSRKSAFLGQLSVDIGRFYAPVPDPGVDPPDLGSGPQASAWNTSKKRIAKEVWGQITVGLDANLGPLISKPAYYHLDQAIEFSDESGLRKFGPEGVLVSVAEPADASDTSYELEIEGASFGVMKGIGDTASDVAQGLASEINNGSEPLLASEVEGLSSNPRLVVAPVARGRSLVIRVRNRQDVAYRLRIDSTAVIEHTPSGGSADEVRDALVKGVNDYVPGAIATALPDSRLKVEFASETSASVLAVAPKADSFEHLAYVESGASLRVRNADPKLSVPTSDSTPLRNATPFLINGPEVWRSRPGLRIEGESSDMQRYWSEKTEIYYHLTKRRWLMAGNQMATFTRLSTMESANESARHAVASILHALIPQATVDPPTYNGQGHFFGNYPDFWDPEDHEFDDLAALRRLDAAVYGSTSGGKPLPHVFEILRLGDWIAGMPADLIEDAFPGQIGKIGGHVLARFDEELGFTEGDEFVKALRELLKAFLKFDPSP